MESIIPVDQPPIKYESPYSKEPPKDMSQSPAKRPLSEVTEAGVNGDEKRRRTSADAAPEFNFDIDAMAQAAAAAAVEDFVQSTPFGTSSTLGNENHNPYTAHANDSSAPTSAADINGGLTSDPHLYMRILSLPILESLSTQILATLTQGPYEETIKITTQPDSELGQAYATLKSLFDQTKKIYSQQNQFLSADQLNIREEEHRSTIRTTNLATFVSSVFGGQDVGFYDLNGHFLEIFVPEGGELQKQSGMLYLNLKTQMFLSAVSQEEQEKPKEEILDELFPESLSDTLISRHPGSALSTNEQTFLNEAKVRRDLLQNEAADAESISVLSDRYSWEDFLQSLGTYLKEAYEPLIVPYMRRHALTAPAPTHATGYNSQSQLDHVDLDADIERATREATQQALQTMGYGAYNGMQTTQGQAQPLQNPGQLNSQNQMMASGYNTEVPYHTQSAPTQVLYEQARQAAVAKTSSHTRRPGLPSQRRPWSTEEENALMAGLDQVKGPHWSQILALYGPKGQISEILKDRNQVQLKDKARNLKLFFLKSNIEVPYYLQCVTGELKTRAPTQAARKEAEERARLASEDSQARFNGIMALAGASQARSQGQPSNGEIQQEQFPQGSPAPAVPERRSSGSQEELRVSEPSEVAFEQDLSARLKESIEGQESSTPTSVTS